MIKKRLKLKTEDFDKSYTNLLNGDFLNIKVHYINKEKKESNLNKEQKEVDTENKQKESNLKIENRYNEVTSKYGIVISKKISKSAVQRNKLKRLLFSVIQNILKNKDNNKLKDKEIKENINNNGINNKKALYMLKVKKSFNKENINKIKEEINFMFDK